MAEEKKETPREERRRKIYNNDRSKAARGEPMKDEPPATRDGHADPATADGKHLMTDDVLGRHAAEREGLRAAHEKEHRDRHNQGRDEHRSMSARHEDEHKGVGDHHAMTALHRRHEHEKHSLRMEHEKRMRDMHERHGNERHALHMKHEAEAMGAASAMDQAGQEGGTAGFAAAA